MSAPDSIEPVVGWRCWRVIDTPDGFELASVNRTTRWPAGLALEATCSVDASHGTPVPECACGIYAARAPDLVVGCFPPVVRSAATIIAPAVLGYDTVVAVGLVSLWGDVIEGVLGWRGQYAYPRELFVPSAVRHYRRGRGKRFEVFDSDKLAAALRDLYAVPVSVTRTVRPAELALRCA